MAAGSERRQEIRGGGALLAFVRTAQTSKIERVLTKNLSASGVAFVSETVRKVGDVLEVEVRLPDFAKEVAFQAVVVWNRVVPATDKSAKAMKCEIGVKITSIDPRSQVLLRQYAAMNPLLS